MTATFFSKLNSANIYSLALCAPQPLTSQNTIISDQLRQQQINYQSEVLWQNNTENVTICILLYLADIQDTLQH